MWYLCWSGSPIFKSLKLTFLLTDSTWPWRMSNMSYFISFGKTSLTILLKKHFYFDSTQRHNIMGFTVFKRTRNVHSACEILDKVRFYLDKEEISFMRVLWEWGQIFVFTSASQLFFCWASTFLKAPESAKCDTWKLYTLKGRRYFEGKRCYCPFKFVTSPLSWPVLVIDQIWPENSGTLQDLQSVLCTVWKVIGIWGKTLIFHFQIQPPTALDPIWLNASCWISYLCFIGNALSLEYWCNFKMCEEL